MTKEAIVIPVARLESDKYSVPRGSIGYGRELEKMPGFYEINWLPPMSGGSLPVAEADLDFDIPELTIFTDYLP